MFGELLLGHVEPLMVHVARLVPTIATKVGGKVVSHVDDLSHVLHLVAEALRARTVADEVEAATTWPEASDATRQILILWCRAMALDSIQIELRFV